MEGKEVVKINISYAVIGFKTEEIWMKYERGFN